MIPIKLARICGILFLYTLCGTLGLAYGQPTIYLVRHAEKLAKWPGGQSGHFQPLSTEGIARSKKLADRFEKGSLSAIYSSLTTRTLHTAFPLSQKLGVPMQIANACMDTSAIDGFLAEIRQKYTDNDAILMVSHSNIVPYLMVKAGLPGDCRKEMGISQSSPSSWLLISGYDNIWKIELNKVDGGRCKSFQRMDFK